MKKAFPFDSSLIAITAISKTGDDRIKAKLLKIISVSLLIKLPVLPIRLLISSPCQSLLKLFCKSAI